MLAASQCREWELRTISDFYWWSNSTNLRVSGSTENMFQRAKDGGSALQKAGRPTLGTRDLSLAARSPAASRIGMSLSSETQAPETVVSLRSVTPAVTQSPELLTRDHQLER